MHDTGKEHCKAATIIEIHTVVDITLKITQKETVRKLFKHLLEMTSMMALKLLVNNKGNKMLTRRKVSIHVE